MLYNYREVLGIYGTDYKLKQALSERKIYRVESGIYSDGKNNFTKYELVLKKYPSAFLVKSSALYHIGFIKTEPDIIHLGTARNALRIRDKRIKQHFYSTLDDPKPDCLYLHNVCDVLRRDNIHSYISKDNSNELRIFNLSALFADLLRDRNFYSRQQLIELLEKFRDCKYFFDENLHFDWSLESTMVDFELLDLVGEVCAEARDRKWRRDWDIDWA